MVYGCTPHAALSDGVLGCIECTAWSLRSDVISSTKILSFTDERRKVVVGRRDPDTPRGIRRDLPRALKYLKARHESPVIA